MFKKYFFLFLFISPIIVSESFAKENYRFKENQILQRKTLTEAYSRFGKEYKPYNSDHSSLDTQVAQDMETLFHLADLAVIEKVILLEVIGKIHDGQLPRDHEHKNYYQEILTQMVNLQSEDKRIQKIRDDLVKGINFHIEALKAWLDAAKKDKVHTVKNSSGRWVHSGTSAGDKIFYSLFYSYINKEFSNEYPENIEALSRHLCVLVF